MTTIRNRYITFAELLAALQSLHLSPTQQIGAVGLAGTGGNGIFKINTDGDVIYLAEIIGMPANLLPVTFVVPRSEADTGAVGDTVATVHAFVANANLQLCKAFLEAVRTAVTHWINTSLEGYEAWQQSCEDLNIGDLANHEQSSLLQSSLNAVGIFGFRIELTNTSPNDDWQFDSLLVNWDDVINKIERT
jgi:hypothetical protein